MKKRRIIDLSKLSPKKRKQVLAARARSKAWNDAHRKNLAMARKSVQSKREYEKKVKRGKISPKIPLEAYQRATGAPTLSEVKQAIDLGTLKRLVMELEAAQTKEKVVANEITRLVSGTK